MQLHFIPTMAILLITSTCAFVPPAYPCCFIASRELPLRLPYTTSLLLANNNDDSTTNTSDSDEERELKAAAATTTMGAKDLLSKYGVAYLATSIPLAAASFGICYALVSSGLPVADVLSKFNIEVNSNSETATNAAIAYAIHKATSPIRFIPTVALTPMVARLIGKEDSADPSGGKND